MSQPSPGSEFLRALAAAALRDGDPAALAERAATGLAGVFRSQKSLVLDVQFTGFLFKGKPLGGADPTLLHAAGQLIVLRLSRVGFTPDASVDDLRVFFEALSLPPAVLGPGGVLGRIASARPFGVYLSASTGEVYRPPRRAGPSASPSPERQGVSVDDTARLPSSVDAPAPEETSAPRGGEAAGAPAAGFDGFGGDGTELSDFELLDDFPALAPPPAAAPTPAASRGVAGPPADARDGDVASNDMFHFFRTAHSDRAEEGADRLAGLLRAAENPARFDELAEAATRAVQRLVRSGDHAEAVELLAALVAEAERPDRTRIFRESAVQALRRVGTPETLHQLQALVEHHGGQERERILHFFAFMGGEVAQMLETLVFRTGDPELRVAVFRQLLRVEGAVQRVAARALGDASPNRTRLMLELAVLPEVDPELAVRWLSEAAGHADAAVRTDAARHAATVGGRGGLRILLDVLNSERDPAVKKVAVQALGALGDPAAVPFLVRVVSDGGDEGVQVAAIVALGRLGSGEALPALLAVVNRRGGLFGGKKLSRPRAAAIAAIGRIHTPAAREVIHSLAGGKDSELAAEAQRVLGTID
ncbi:MAG TPA: HEAT repeat domain-containing protein [Longimicrobium sp.]|jgi:HEAT repeat protein|nr:HEAT repeat domain-containing protein [Longimicrobium sp.]